MGRKSAARRAAVAVALPAARAPVAETAPQRRIVGVQDGRRQAGQQLAQPPPSAPS
ncbi:hypothetical protein ACIRPT_17255 [Streptomyces sp. NPDC101227]|uniref:hypothetical protein n=1 Tax=Streptomyces sp. NPDC101227 TaxID=3366136 RepID=UPI0037FC41FE